jgi:hypothetical protein
MFNMRLPAPGGPDAEGALAFVMGDGEWSTLNPDEGVTAIATLDDVQVDVAHTGDEAGSHEVRIIRGPQIEGGAGVMVLNADPGHVIVQRTDDSTTTTTTTNEQTREIKFVGPDGASKEIRVERVDGGEPRVWINGAEVDPADSDVQIITADDPETDVAAEMHEHLMELISGHLNAAGVTIDGEAIDGGLQKIFLRHHPGAEAFAFAAHGDAGAWVAENVAGDVTREQVKERLLDVRNAPLSAFLKMHPEADHNEDGVLTEAERDRYIDSSTSRARQKLLERFPDADADQDGLLTDTELHEFFKARHGVRVRTRAGDDGAEVEATAGSVTAEASAPPVIKQRRAKPD